MKISIFIKTYKNDFAWLFYCLKSIKKYCTGYDKVIIIVPSQDAKEWNAMKFDFPKRTEIFFVNEEGNGYLFQQYVKMSAWKYSDADYIKFFDSDCIFTEKVNLQDEIAGGKPTILYTDYNKVEDAICWKKPTEKFIGQEINYELMRRNGLVYHRSTLENAYKLHSDLKERILNSKQFSEFNAIGAYALTKEKSKYTFINTDTGKFKPTPFKQYWSWSGLTPEEKKELQSLL